VPPCVLIITASASAFFSECFGKCLSECSIHIAIAIVIFVTHKQKGRCTATPFQSASYRGNIYCQELDSSLPFWAPASSLMVS
jgi:hypothetical protein